MLTNFVENSLILTPNQRLAYHLQQQYAEMQRQQQKTAWVKPKIFPLDTWLSICWQDCSDQKILLTAIQEYLLWNKIAASELHDISPATVSLMQQAYEIINEWEINPEIWNYVTDDIIFFQNILSKFTSEITQQSFITRSQITAQLASYFQQRELSVPNEIILYGFNELTPAAAKFFTTLEKMLHVKITRVDPNNFLTAQVQKIPCKDSKHEIALAASWAQQKISRHPKCQIGFVVPKIAEYKNYISAMFEITCPNNFNISLGDTFFDLPIVAHAFALLAVQPPLTQAVSTQLLLSPFIIGYEQEKNARALLAVMLQKSSVMIDEFYSASSHAKNISLFINVLQNLRKFFTETPTVLSSSGWAKLFAKKLELFGWDKSANLTVEESKIYTHFAKTLHDFAQLDFLLGSITESQALFYFKVVLQHTIYQTTVSKAQSVQILGTLEAAGLNFDYLWVMGMDQDNWPAAPTPNPFIPIELQKKLPTPHATAKRELEFAQNLLTHFAQSAPEVIFSYATQTSTHTLMPSSLLQQYSTILPEELNLEKITTAEQKIYASKLVEHYVDDLAPRLDSTESIKTGSRLIELQALCPFRAFAELRLHAEEITLDQARRKRLRRGNALHYILEKFYQKIPSKTQLCLLAPAALEQLIMTTISNALQHKFSYESEFEQSLEHQALTKLLNAWLQEEKNRLDFTVIATEQEVELDLDLIKLKLRIDRIDQCSDNSIILIDYKTGKQLPTENSWLSERPDKPQIPLYCLAVPKATTVGLAQINLSRITLQITSLEKLAEKLNQELTPNIRDYWEKNLKNLAQEFVTGHAKVKPLHQAVCKNCQLLLLCRYNKAED